MTDLTISISLLAVIFAMVAFFYASVGLGGGSSYTALLAIFGAGAATIPMVSLTLNVLVTTVGSIVFLSQRHARLRLIAPFLISSIPMAYVGGMLHLPKMLFYMVLLVSLTFAAMRIYFPQKTKPLELDDQGKFCLALGCGAILGLIAGIAGIGGGAAQVIAANSQNEFLQKCAESSPSWLVYVSAFAAFSLAMKNITDMYYKRLEFKKSHDTPKT